MPPQRSENHSNSGTQTRVRIILPAIVLVLLLLSPVSFLAPRASSDPNIIDNGNMTKSVFWNFANPANYTLSNTVIAGGFGMLEHRNETVVENTTGGYDLGTKSNMGSRGFPDSLVIENSSAPMTSVVLQPGSSDGVDTYIDAGQQNNNFGSGDIKMDSEAGKDNRILMWFNLTSIPAGAVVHDATFSLFMKNAKIGPVSFEIYPLNKTFDEDTVTWMNRNSTDTWDNPGGDYVPICIYRSTIDWAYDWHYMDLSWLVDLWVGGRMPNNGFIIVPVSAPGDLFKTFYGSETGSSPELRPRLAINYTVPGAAGSYESSALGPGTNSTFTLASWSQATASLASDEFPGPFLSPKWSWLNNPYVSGGSFGFASPGWLTITAGAPTEMWNTTFTSSYMFQSITGYFTATVSVREHFTRNTMGTGLLLHGDLDNWVSIHRSGFGSNGTVLVVCTQSGISQTLANIPWANESTAFLRLDRTSTGIQMYTSHDGLAWSLICTYAPQMDFMSSARIGACIFSGPVAANAVAEFDYLRIEPQGQTTTFTIKARVGNSSSLTDPSWGAWSGDLSPKTGTMLGLAGRYIQYQINASTSASWISPIFSGFTCHYERYAPTGSITTEECTPADLLIWESMKITQTAAPGVVEYWYSTDDGASWVRLGYATTYSLLVSEPSIIIRININSDDTSVTPLIDTIELVYRRGLSAFYVSAPTVVAAGKTFSFSIEAKDLDNNTMTEYGGPVTLHAMNAAGTADASHELVLTSAVVPTGGTVTVSNERYDAAETIRILVTGSGVSGLSDPIAVVPGDIVRITIAPNITKMIESTSQAFEAIAYDALDNPIAGVPMTWTVDASLGTLNTTDGSLVLLTVGLPLTEGYLNVTSGVVTESRFITVSKMLFAPVIDPDIPRQVQPEDYGQWTLNITDYVSDVENSVTQLRWYTTHESLVKVKGENITGNMEITFDTIQDLNGLDILNLVVVDLDGMSSTMPLYIEITPVNDAPTIDTIDPLVVQLGYAYLFNFLYYVHDVDNSTNDLSITVDLASRNHVTVDRLTAVFFYNDGAMLETTRTVVVTVSDGLDTAVTGLVVKITNDGIPKVIKGMDNIVLNQGENAYIYDLPSYFNDPDNDVLYYATGNDHVMVEILTNHTARLTAPEDWFGSEYVIFQAIDPYGGRAEIATYVTVVQVNKPPVIQNVPDLCVRYDESYEIDLAPYVYDADEANEALEFSVDDVHAYFMGTVLSLLYPASMNGMRVTVNITVSDDDYSSKWMINVTISENYPPRVIKEPPAHSFQEDLEMPYPMSGGLGQFFIDNESGNLLSFFAFSTNPKVNVSVEPNLDTLTYVVYFDVWQDWYGESEFTIRALDPMGAFVEKTVPLDVIPVPDAPVVDLDPTLEVTAGEQFALNLKPFVTDPDSSMDKGDFSFQVRMAGKITNENEHYADNIEILPGMLLFKFDKDFTGEAKEKRFDIEVRVTDQDGKVTSDTMTIIVKRAPGSSNIMLEMALLITGSAAVGLFFVAFRMRKKPFVIRDMMLIHNDGFLIGRYAGHSNVEGEIDKDILSGMLTAVLNFVDDSMSTSHEMLKTFGFKDYQVLVQRGTKSFAAIVYEGDLPNNIGKSVGDFLATFERIYKKKIAGWSGDIETDFAGVEVLIQSFVKEHSKRSAGKVKKLWVSKKGESDTTAK